MDDLSKVAYVLLALWITFFLGVCLNYLACSKFEEPTEDEDARRGIVRGKPIRDHHVYAIEVDSPPPDDAEQDDPFSVG